MRRSDAEDRSMSIAVVGEVYAILRGIGCQPKLAS